MWPLILLLASLVSAHDDRRDDAVRDYTNAEVAYASLFLALILFCILAVWLSMACERPRHRHVIRYVIHRGDIVPDTF